MSDNLQQVPTPAVPPPPMTPNEQRAAQDRAVGQMTPAPNEQRTAGVVAQNEAQAAAEKKQREDTAAREKAQAEALSKEHRAAVVPAPDPNVEPRLVKLIRFEAGTVHDLLEYMRVWVDWRIAGGKSATPGISAEGVMDEPTRLANAQRLGLSARATQAEIEAADPAVITVMDEPARLAAAQRLGLSTRATPAEIGEAEADRRATADAGVTKIGGGAIYY
jgi:hypothetical protein